MEENQNNDSDIIAVASVYDKTYYQTPAFKSMPPAVWEEIRQICTFFAEKLHCEFSICFKKNGDVYFKTYAKDWDYHFDDIGAKLDLDKLASDKQDFFKSLKLWYMAFVLNMDITALTNAGSEF